MKSYDFDIKTQQIFIEFLKEYKKINWNKWLDINSTQEYEEEILKNSGLVSVQNLTQRIKKEKLDSRVISVNLHSYVENYTNKDPLILCHSSGTTNSDPEGLKWFHMKKSLVYQLWAPGMQAIFESSELNSDSSAIIFVPSRMNFDGINDSKKNDYISLYTSEFSQRTVLAILKPKQYLISQYRFSKNLDIILRILSMDNIKIISAPAMTVLGWADLNKFTTGLKKSLKNIKENQNELILDYVEKIKQKGIEKIAKELQERLSEKLKNATLIFGISSLTEQQWQKIRAFLKWNDDVDRFNNLYVGSEFGPFASSLTLGKKEMYVLPLTFPVIEHNNNRMFISNSAAKRGTLLISRMNDLEPLVNINTDDVISVFKQDGLPQIDGKIIRTGFKLNYDIKISNQIKLPLDFKILAGNYFNFGEFEIVEPRNLLNCIKSNCEIETDALVLVKEQSDEKIWKLIVLKPEDDICQDKEKIFQILYNCPQLEKTKWIQNRDLVEIELLNEQPVQFLKNREEILLKVRSGALPKGILKKWPLYIVIPS